MAQFDLPIHKNPLQTRGDVERALLEIMEPVMGHFTQGNAGLHLGDSGAHYGQNSTQVEAFSRMLWGLAPLWFQGGGQEYLPPFRAGLVSGTDPEHPAYWGAVFDFDQKIVEMAAISLLLLLNGDRLALTEREARNIHDWMDGVNGCDIPKNNWFFFRVLVNITFECMGWAYNAVQMAEDLERLDSFYLGDGWYCDGQPTQIDYYIPFAMHYYGLIYAKFMAEKDPIRSRTYKERAAQFAGDYLYWFGDDGSAVPFGRSLTYRFGQCAFFSALAFADVPALPWGVVKSRVLGNLRYWFSQPIFAADGLLSVGYCYPNLCMSENYNSPASSYWAFKAFLCLALPDDHPFWTAEEEVPKLLPQKCLPHAHMLLTRDQTQVQMFLSGQRCAQLGQCDAKYGKLVYSNRFGFSVPRGHSLEEGAFDNQLAVSEAGEAFFRAHQAFLEDRAEETCIYRKFSPLRGVIVEVTVTPSFPRHRREYVITTDRPIDVADGGFAIPAEGDGVPFAPDELALTPNGVQANFKWGISGICCEGLPCEPMLIKAFPNTNLISPVTRIPTVLLHLGAGTHRFTTTVIGVMN